VTGRLTQFTAPILTAPIRRETDGPHGEISVGPANDHADCGMGSRSVRCAATVSTSGHHRPFRLRTMGLWTAGPGAPRLPRVLAGAVFSADRPALPSARCSCAPKGRTDSPRLRNPGAGGHRRLGRNALVAPCQRVPSALHRPEISVCGSYAGRCAGGRNYDRRLNLFRRSTSAQSPRNPDIKSFAAVAADPDKR